MSIRFVKRKGANLDLDSYSALVALADQSLVKAAGDGTVAAATTNESYIGVTSGASVVPETSDTGDTNFDVAIIPADDETIFAVTPQAAVTESAAIALKGSYKDFNGTGSAVTIATAANLNSDVKIVGYNIRIGQTNIDEFLVVLNRIA